MTRQTVDGRLCRPVAVDAPSHLKAADARNDIHRIHRAMALRAGHLCTIVRCMIETHESRHGIHLHPPNGRAILPVAGELLHIRMLPEHNLMASHTPLDGRHAGETGSPSSAVAIRALDSVVGDVNAVAECDGLFGCVGILGVGPHLGGRDDRDERHGGDRN